MEETERIRGAKERRKWYPETGREAALWVHTPSDALGPSFTVRCKGCEVRAGILTEEPPYL